MEKGIALDDYIYPEVNDFVEDQALVMAMMANGPCKTYCYQRLQYLDAKYKLHDLLNGACVSFEHLDLDEILYNIW